jgi:hypothetical protein
LVKLYDGKHLVIKNKKVIGAYDSDAEAIETARKNHQIGTYIVQLCTPGPDAYTRSFHGGLSFVGI